MFKNLIRRQTNLAKLVAPVLYLGTLAGAGLLVWGATQQNNLDIARTHGERANPWRGLPGCTYLPDHENGGLSYWPLSKASATACDEHELYAFDQPVMGQSATLLKALRQHTQEPATALPMAKDGTAAPNVQYIDGKSIAQGQHITLTLDAVNQPLAQQLANCMTANAEPSACEQFERPGKTPNSALLWPQHHEGAAARMLALVDLDIASGQVRALASAHSPCFAQHWLAKSVKDLDCPAMPAIAAPQPWRLDNHATNTTAMPASTDKVWLMLNLLRSPEGAALQQGVGRSWVQQTLKTSDSVALFNRLLCADKKFSPDCPRIHGLARAAYDLGYDGAVLELLHPAKPNQPGQPDQPSLTVPNGRYMQHQPTRGGAWTWLPTTMPSAVLLSRCAANKYEKCEGHDVALLLSELWGQGNSQATALSAAQMMARLGAAANGQKTAAAHLILHLGDELASPAPQKVAIARAHASLITEGLSLTHQSGGTAHAACAAVLGASACNRIGYVAGKTGTPAYALEKLSVDERASQCEQVQEGIRNLLNAEQKPQPSLTTANARCHMTPYKWYVALVKDSTQPTAPYTRAIAVLAERNYRLDGAIDSKGDRGINIAAEMAWSYIAQTHPALRPSNDI